MKILFFILQLIVVNSVFSAERDTLSQKADTIFSKFLRMEHKVVAKNDIDTLNLFDSLYPWDRVFYNKGKAKRSIRFKTDASCVYVDSVFAIRDCLLISGKHLGFARHDFILIYDLFLKKHEIHYLIPQDTSIKVRLYLIRAGLNW